MKNSLSRKSSSKATRATKAEMAKRRAIIKDLIDEGYSTTEIVAVLAEVFQINPRHLMTLVGKVRREGRDEELDISEEDEIADEIMFAKKVRRLAIKKGDAATALKANEQIAKLTKSLKKGNKNGSSADTSDLKAKVRDILRCYQPSAGEEST